MADIELIKKVENEINKNFSVDLGTLPLKNRSYEDITKCLMIAYDKGRKDTLEILKRLWGETNETINNHSCI